MTDATHPQQSQSIGFKRWIIIALIIGGGFLAFGIGGIWKPVPPAVKLPAEPIWPGVPLTNTILATLIVDLILFALAWRARAFAQSGQLVPQGFYNFFEFLVEFLWDAAESTAGKWAKAIFPFTATIFFLVFTANMVKALPIFETVGYLEQAHGTVKGYETQELIPGLLYALNGAKEVTHEEPAAEAGAEAGHAPAEGEHAEEMCTACEVVPFLRGSATDINFTFSMALIAMIWVQVMGVRALGAGYFTKFFNTGGMISKPFFGVIDFGVGLLELVSEFAKVLSFGFRLFGNIFAGALLLAILGALTAVIVPSMLYTLEIFVGAIQAYVFSMLALVFMAQATVSHHGDDHGDHAEHGEAAPAAH